MAIAILRRRPPSELLPSKAVEELIEHFEGCVLYAYDDKENKYPKTRITPENAHRVKGRLTIGFGRAVGVKPGDTCTMAEAREWLREDIAKHAQIVRDTITVPLTQSEFDALTDIAFNFGYIPPSMRACLNGGTTDKGKVMTPGSYGSAAMEFPRNCRWGGIPNQELYRRRMADACLFHDLPWQNACSKNIVKLVVDANQNPDPVESTSLEDTLMRARLDTSRVPDTSATLTKPWSELVPQPKPEASVTIIEDKDELVLTTPAAPVSVPAPAAGQPAEPPSPPPAAPAKPLPTPASLGSGQAEAKPVAIGPNSPPAPQAPPVPVAPPAPPAPPVKAAPPPEPPPPPVPIGQQTSAVDAARKSEEWSSSAKSMIYSRRFWGLFLVVVGRVWMLKTGSNAVLGAVSDPLVMEMFSGFMVMVIGEAVQHWGERKATRPLK